jgi:hypothetical protein
VEEELSLVVGGASGIDPPVPDLGLEGRGAPELKRLWRLDVEVSIDEKGRGIRSGPSPLADRDRVSGGLPEMRLESGPDEGVDHPLASATRIPIEL